MEALFGPLIIFFLAVLIKGVKVDREYERGVIFRLGRLSSIKGPGMYWIMPVVDQKMKMDIWGPNQKQGAFRYLFRSLSRQGRVDSW